MSRIMCKRNAQDRQNGQQSCFACDQQMRHRDIAKLAPDHEQEANNSSLADLMPAESQPKLMPFMQETAQVHSVKYPAKRSIFSLVVSLLPRVFVSQRMRSRNVGHSEFERPRPRVNREQLQTSPGCKLSYSQWHKNSEG